MDILMIILRILHIISSGFWLGAGMMNLYFVVPTTQAIGPDGQKFTGHLVRRTRYVAVVSAAAGLTVLTGLIMYWRIFGARINVGTGYGWGMTLGGLFGTVAFVIAMIFIVRPINKMKAILAAVESAGGPPSPEQASQMQTLGATVGQGGTWTVITGVLAMVGMASAQYLAF